jgi:hypothetical protein
MHGREERFLIIDLSPPLGLSCLTAHFVIVIGSSWLSMRHLQLHLSRRPDDHLLLTRAQDSKFAGIPPDARLPPKIPLRWTPIVRQPEPLFKV